MVVTDRFHCNENVSIISWRWCSVSHNPVRNSLDCLCFVIVISYAVWLFSLHEYLSITRFNGHIFTVCAAQAFKTWLTSGESRNKGTLQWRNGNTMASQITGLAIAYSTFCSGTDQWKHQSSASLAFVKLIHLWPVNSSYNGPMTWKMLPSNEIIMKIWLSSGQSRNEKNKRK